MGPLNLARLISAISRVDGVEWATSGLISVPSPPFPYVAPKFRIESSTSSATTAAEKLAVEVIFVQAPAAVGKSVTAKHLASLLNVPVLDLARAGIGGASLDGLLGRSAFYGGSRDRTRAINEFHIGALPIIVDALDEGQMVSGQTAFEAFLESTAELILEDRRVRNKPKVIFFGRPEATELSDAAVQIAGNEDISVCTVNLEFFAREEATRLVKAYTKDAMVRAGNARRSALLERSSPYDDLTDWYFRSIEKALQIAEGELWTDSGGRPFAGYAPVLSAIGRLLADIEQPHTAINDLQHDGEETAWDVIERVMQYILGREQHKVTEPLEREFGSALDQDTLAYAYGPYEQLAYLLQLLQKGPIVATGEVRFTVPAHNQRYMEHVANFCADHAFIRHGDATNEVFESFILTNAIRSNNLANDFADERLKRLSRYPFLWRSFWRHEQARAKNEPSVDGRYVGHILRSYCSDPLTNRASRIYIVEGNRGAKITGMTEDAQQDSILFDFSTTIPVQLFGSIRNCDVDLGASSVEIVGDSKLGGARSFQFLGENAVTCSVAEINTEWIVIKGSLVIETAEAAAPHSNLKLLVEGGRLSAAGAICNVPPWNDWAIERGGEVEVNIPQRAKQAFQVLKLMEVKLGSYPFLYTSDRNEVDTDDPKMKWLRRQNNYRDVLNVSVSTGVARREAVDAAGAYNQRIRFLVSLSELMEAREYLLAEVAAGQASKKIISREIRNFWKRYEVE